MKKVLVILANGCEELEAVTVIDLLRRAEIDVITASLDNGKKVNPITASRGVIILADTTLDEAIKSDYDMVVLPGGLPGADYLDNDNRVNLLLQKMVSNNKFVAAICAAPKVLAHANLLDGKNATSYPGVLENMSLANTNVLSDNVVIDDKIITSRGPATAMEFSLNLIEQLLDKNKRDEVAMALLLP
jgi:4-methyl-5(b-hydroxyethyl)-thiazole monophosphate biosynthesis